MEEAKLDKIDHLHELVKLLIKRQEQQDKALMNISTQLATSIDFLQHQIRMAIWSCMEFYLTLAKEEVVSIESYDEELEQITDFKEKESEKMLEAFERSENVRKFVKKNLNPARFNRHPIDTASEESDIEVKIAL